MALLSRLIDHAPLFPPASLPLPEAVEEDRRARESEAAFVLARFVCPGSLLPELRGEERELSVVLDGELARDERVAAVEAHMPDSLDALVGVAPEVYVEVPLGDGLEGRLDAVRDAGLRAKVRCGGASAPSGDELAAFVRRCRERGLVFKATAGLHHAVRNDGEHGFLNLLAAVVFGDEEAALDETDPDAFRLDADAFAWREREAGPSELARARAERLWSIGSCSFFEPVGELDALGMLP